MLCFEIANLLNFFSDLLTSLNSLLLFSDTSHLTTVFTTFNPIIPDQTITSFSQIEAIGHGIYTYGAVLLIITSVILLLAMVAPIFINTNTNKD